MKTGKRLVQVILPKDVAEWVRAQSEKEGVKVGTWLRRMLMSMRDASPSDEKVERRLKKLERRVCELQRWSHPPFDFTHLVRRLEALERKQELPDGTPINRSRT